MNRIEHLIPKPCAGTHLHRATVCLWADSLEEKVDFTAWLNTWKRKVPYLSRDYGCGCCIHLFDLEAPKEALDALPRDLLTVSPWTEHGVRPAPQPDACG